MKQAKYFTIKHNKLQCTLCPHNCIIKENQTGICGVRKNIAGKFFSLVFGKGFSHVDPIEKKPFYHFLPGTKTFSVGTVGCNMKCMHCQNWDISQKREIPRIDLPPKKIIELALKNNCKSISYTYNEPTIFYEYMIETAEMAKENHIKNTIVSNGFINPEPLKALVKFIDAANIDIKAFDNEFYINTCKARLQPVLDSLKILKNNVWLETTTLIIPTLNDDLQKIEQMCQWIQTNIGNVPMHFSRFHPHFQLMHLPATDPEILVKARDIALKYVDHVYIGNILIPGANKPQCKICNSSKCGHMPGVWE